MKKILALIALCSIGLTVGVGYFYWQQATTLPEWITETPEPSPANTAAMPAAAPTPPARSTNTIQEKFQTAKPGAVQEQLTTAEVNNLIVSGLTKSSHGSNALPKAIRSIKTQIQQDQIRTGAVIDLAEIGSMPPSPRTEMMNKMVKLMPQLRGKPVYIGVVGKLSVKDGQPQLSADSKLQIGQVELPLDDAAKKMGVSRSALEQSVLNYLQFRDLNLEKIDLTDQGAVITGQKK